MSEIKSDGSLCYANVRMTSLHYLNMQQTNAYPEFTCGEWPFQPNKVQNSA